MRQDDGEIVLTEDVSSGEGRALLGHGHRPLKTSVDEDRSLVGGLLPPGAVSAEVITDRGMRIAAEIGRGAYAAIVDLQMDHHEPVVCCRDDAGAPVRWPLPADYSSVLVDDAEEPCPACGAPDYEECVPTESWLLLASAIIASSGASATGLRRVGRRALSVGREASQSADVAVGGVAACTDACRRVACRRGGWLRRGPHPRSPV